MSHLVPKFHCFACPDCRRQRPGVQCRGLNQMTPGGVGRARPATIDDQDAVSRGADTTHATQNGIVPKIRRFRAGGKPVDRFRPIIVLYGAVEPPHNPAADEYSGFPRLVDQGAGRRQAVDEGRWLCLGSRRAAKVHVASLRVPIPMGVDTPVKPAERLRGSQSRWSMEGPRMDYFVIRGGTRLEGVVEISGAKNAALPIMAACLMADGPTVLARRPTPHRHRLSRHPAPRTRLSRRSGRAFADRDLLHPPKRSIAQRHADDRSRSTKAPCEAPDDLVQKMRASISVLGPLLARRGRAVVPVPGGCKFGTRPIDLHLKGLEKLGARFETEDGCVVGTVPGGRLKGTTMFISAARKGRPSSAR